jgi:hypothetical protein
MSENRNERAPQLFLGVALIVIATAIAFKIGEEHPIISMFTAGGLFIWGMVIIFRNA